MTPFYFSPWAKNDTKIEKILMFAAFLGSGTIVFGIFGKALLLLKPPPWPPLGL